MNSTRKCPVRKYSVPGDMESTMVALALIDSAVEIHREGETDITITSRLSDKTIRRVLELGRHDKGTKIVENFRNSLFYNKRPFSVGIERVSEIDVRAYA